MTQAEGGGSGSNAPPPEIDEKYAKYIVRGESRACRTVLLKGASGTGKTYQFRTLDAEGMMGLYVDVEAKLASIKDLDPPLWWIRKPDVPLTPSDKTSMIANGTSDFIMLCDFIRGGKHPYDFVYFDSLMRYASKLVDYLRYDKNLTGFDLWGAFAQKMKKMLELLTSLASAEHPRPVHVIATWGVEIGQNWEGKRAVQPIVDGKVVGPLVDYFFDDVLYLTKREDPTSGKVEFMAYTGGTHEVSAKVSKPPSAKIPHIIADPNLGRLIKLLQETK